MNLTPGGRLIFFYVTYLSGKYELNRHENIGLY